MENLSGCFTMPWMTSLCWSGSMSGDAGVVALEDQAVGRDDAELVLQRRHAPVGPVLPVDEDVGAAALDLLLELRGHAVGFGSMMRPISLSLAATASCCAARGDPCRGAQPLRRPTPRRCAGSWRRSIATHRAWPRRSTVSLEASFLVRHSVRFPLLGLVLPRCVFPPLLIVYCCAELGLRIRPRRCRHASTGCEHQALTCASGQPQA